MNTVNRYIYAAIGILLTTQISLASWWDKQVEIIDDFKIGSGNDNPVTTIQIFIAGLLSFLGIIMVGMTLWGGWKILTSGSNDEGKEAGKKIIINAVIGIVVIFFAWTLTSLVFSVLDGGGTVAQ